MAGLLFQARIRFIPAQAGNTRAIRLPIQYPTVHPRAGGEHALKRPFSS